MDSSRVLGYRHQRYERIWNQGDEATAFEILAPDLHFRGSTGASAEGVAGFLAYVRLIRAALSPYRCEIEDLVIEGPRVFARMRFAGVHVGTFFGVAPTGAELAWAGAAHFEIHDGRIGALWVLGDVDHLKIQLGIARPIGP